MLFRSPGDTLAGASTNAPLIALGADIRLAGNESDTNSKRFKTGMLDAQEYWETICKDNVRFVVSSPRSYFARPTMQRLAVIRKFFRPVKAFYDPELRYGARFPLCIYERINRDEPCEWTRSAPTRRSSSAAFCPVE